MYSSKNDIMNLRNLRCARCHHYISRIKDAAVEECYFSDGKLIKAYSVNKDKNACSICYGSAKMPEAFMGIGSGSIDKATKSLLLSKRQIV